MIPISAILGVFYTIVIIHLWKHIADFYFDHDIDNKQREYDNYLSKRFNMPSLLPGTDLEEISRIEARQEKYNLKMQSLSQDISKMKWQRMWYFILYLLFFIGAGIAFFCWYFSLNWELSSFIDVSK